MKESIFKDQSLQDEFDRAGFVKFRLFSPETITELRGLLAQYIQEDPVSFFSSSYLDEFQVKKEVSDSVVACIQNEVDAVFTNIRLLGAAFLIKGKGEHSEMPMHQDWTIVDENQFYAANMWIPLVSTTEENGTLELLEGSHMWDKALRAPTLPMAFQGHEDIIKPCLTVVHAEPGEVVILNQATIHYSKPNLSDKIRPAITCGVISAKAPLIFHYWDAERKQIERFAEDDEFLLRFENFHEAIYKRPVIGESMGFFDYDIPRFSEAEMRIRLGLETLEKEHSSRGFFQRLFGKS